MKKRERERKCPSLVPPLGPKGATPTLEGSQRTSLWPEGGPPVGSPRSPARVMSSHQREEKTRFLQSSFPCSSSWGIARNGSLDDGDDRGFWDFEADDDDKSDPPLLLTVFPGRER